MTFSKCLLGLALATLVLGACEVGSGHRIGGGSGGSGSSGGTTSDASKAAACSVSTDCFPDASSVSIIQMVPQCLSTSTGGYCTRRCQLDSDCCSYPGECPKGQIQVCVPFVGSDTDKVCAVSCDSSDIAKMLGTKQSFLAGDASVSDTGPGGWGDGEVTDAGAADSPSDSSLVDSGKQDASHDASSDGAASDAHVDAGNDAADGDADAEAGKDPSITPDQFCVDYVRDKFRCRFAGSGSSARKACLP